MTSNLKEFVEKFVQREVRNTFPHLYIVDKQTGPYRKIQDAINAAQPHSLIKISQGFYEQNLVIKKPLRLQPKSASTSQSSTQKIGVVLLVNSGNAITIKLPEIDTVCIISGIKISHSGNSQNHIKKQLMEHEHILNIFQNRVRDIEQLEHEYVNRVAFSKVENTILMLEKGKLQMENCILSLNYLVKSCSTIIPAVCIQKQAVLQMRFCQIKGHPQKQTIGIVCKLGTLHLQNSILTNHKEGGVLIWGIGNNTSRIIKNKLSQNSVAIHVVGEEFKLKVYNNNISGNKVGVKVGLASQADISRNTIQENEDGIQVTSAFPIIYLNIIQKNKNTGIICRSYKKFLCQAQIKKNIAIVGNRHHGIFVQGQNNKTKIIQNHLIAFNHECGIKICGKAFPLVLMNKVVKNYKEGILIVEKSNAIVEKNELLQNVECNVALGGEGSHHTILVDNVVKGSMGPGIIMVKAGRCKIVRNDVVGNAEGIVMVQSMAEIRRNYLADNKNNGMVCEESSQPKVIENFITRNQSMGAFLRDQSGGNVSRGTHESVIHSNIMVNNEVQVGLQSQNSTLINQLKQTNTIGGQVQYPQKVGCGVY